MAPRPVLDTQRRGTTGHPESAAERKASTTEIIAAYGSIATIAWLIVSFTWAQRWLVSGCAIQSLLLISGSLNNVTAFRRISLWSTLALFNIFYAVVSTSWLQYRLFMAVCWSCVVVTILLVSPITSKMTRKISRRLLRQGHFVKDGIAFFDMPALHLDSSSEGLVVVRGWTISLTTLTIEAHGIEIAINLSNGVHLALYCDTLSVRLCRGIDVDNVYGVVKPERFEVNQGDLSEHAKERKSKSEHPLDVTDRASGAHMSDDRRSKANSAARKESATTPNVSADLAAERRYLDVRRDIKLQSPLHQCQSPADGTSVENSDGCSQMTRQKSYAAICARLQDVPSISHPPKRSIRVTTILDLIPSWLRRILARMPYLLRLLLMPLSHLHPTKFSSVTVAASGSWMASVMEEKVYEKYNEDRDDVRHLKETANEWMTDATFCLNLSEIHGVGQVPVGAYHDIVTYLRCAHSTLFRIATDPQGITPALQLNGADATLVIPSYLLPCHEHMLPPAPSSRTHDYHEPRTGDESPEEDKTEIEMMIHLSFPAFCDQSVIDFLGDAAEAAQIWNVGEKDTDEARSSSQDESKIGRARSKLANQAKNIGEDIKSGLKKVAFNKVTNDDWLHQVVSKTAAQLEHLRGDFGYSGSIPVSLKPYRVSVPSKWIT